MADIVRMRQLEAQMVAKMKTFEARREYLRGVEKVRGEKGRRELECLVLDLWSAKKPVGEANGRRG